MIILCARLIFADILSIIVLRSFLVGGTLPIRQDSKETQTITPLPQRLQVHVPIHCATIKATNREEKSGKSADEKLTLEVSILDVPIGAPLKCTVALLGDERTPSDGRMICFLSISVSVVGESNLKKLTAKQNELSYSIWRSKKNGYSANGRVKFYMCFYEADVNYIVTLNIAKIHDEEGIECIGYAVEHYTGFISTVKTVERNAFKAPPLMKYEGAIASPKFNKLMSIYNQMFYQGRKEESNMIMSRITSNDSTAEHDVKLYMSISKATEKSFDPQTIVQLEELFQRSQSLDSTNGFLFQALIMMSLSQTHSFQGNREKALECIHHSRSVCLEAAPSHLTSCVFFNNARNMISVNKGTITPQIKRRILELFDRAIADSYYGTGWERIMIFNGHVYKALFCLNGIIDLFLPSIPNYTPTKEDISIAEQHLNAAPLDAVCEVHMHIVIYYIACSDLHRWKRNTEKAREFAEKAKWLCTEKGYFLSTIPAIDKRLKLLEPDTVDEVLKQFEEHV